MAKTIYHFHTHILHKVQIACDHTLSTKSTFTILSRDIPLPECLRMNQEYETREPECSSSGQGKYVVFNQLPEGSLNDRGEPALNRYSTFITKDHDFPASQVSSSWQVHSAWSRNLMINRLCYTQLASLTRRLCKIVLTWE